MKARITSNWLMKLVLRFTLEKLEKLTFQKIIRDFFSGKFQKIGDRNRLVFPLRLRLMCWAVCIATAVSVQNASRVCSLAQITMRHRKGCSNYPGQEGPNNTGWGIGVMLWQSWAPCTLLHRSFDACATICYLAQRRCFLVFSLVLTLHTFSLLMPVHCRVRSTIIWTNC